MHSHTTAIVGRGVQSSENILELTKLFDAAT